MQAAAFSASETFGEMCSTFFRCMDQASQINPLRALAQLFSLGTYHADSMPTSCRLPVLALSPCCYSEQFAEGINRGGEGDLLVAGGDSKR